MTHHIWRSHASKRSVGHVAKYVQRLAHIAGALFHSVANFGRIEAHADQFFAQLQILRGEAAKTLQRLDRRLWSKPSSDKAFDGKNKCNLLVLRRIIPIRSFGRDPDYVLTEPHRYQAFPFRRQRRG